MAGANSALFEKMKAPISRTQYLSDAMYGMVNGIMIIPVVISFCSIIYRDPAYEAVLPSLVKLVLLSGAIHQLSFSLFSSLPFAVGQVQDAGLIFLSAMAGDIALNYDSDKYELLPTTLVVLNVATFFLGIMLYFLGRFKLVSVVQYLPMPVIGGYLAFIGFFCGEAGLAMMSGVEVASIFEWYKFYSWERATLYLPGLAIGISLYIVLRNVRSPFTLPISLAIILVAFYCILFFTGTPLEAAREAGWVAPLVPPAAFYHMWDLYHFDKVDWSQLLPQLPRFLSMFFVVAFSSSLDVAAIEMELGLPLDFNREMKVVGLSNVASGLTGGYTGSYIFSQTIFCLRRGVSTKLCGLVIASFELFVVVLPVPLTCFIPKLFFGSLLVLIAVDLMWEWLICSRGKMTTVEFLICLFTFCAVQGAGLEGGMFLGVLLSMIFFVISYAGRQSSVVQIDNSRHSRVVRTFEEEAVLRDHHHKITTLSLEGYVFFGTAVRILEEVKKGIFVTEEKPVSTNGGSTDGTPKRRYSFSSKHGMSCSSAASIHARNNSLRLESLRSMSRDTTDGGGGVANGIHPMDSSRAPEQANSLTHSPCTSSPPTGRQINDGLSTERSAILPPSSSSRGSAYESITTEHRSPSLFADGESNIAVDGIAGNLAGGGLSVYEMSGEQISAYQQSYSRESGAAAAAPRHVMLLGNSPPLRTVSNLTHLPILHPTQPHTGDEEFDEPWDYHNSDEETPKRRGTPGNHNKHLTPSTTKKSITRLHPFEQSGRGVEMKPMTRVHLTGEDAGNNTSAASGTESASLGSGLLSLFDGSPYHDSPTFYQQATPTSNQPQQQQFSLAHPAPGTNLPQESGELSARTPFAELAATGPGTPFVSASVIDVNRREDKDKALASELLRGNLFFKKKQQERLLRSEAASLSAADATKKKSRPFTTTGSTLPPEPVDDLTRKSSFRYHQVSSEEDVDDKPEDQGNLDSVEQGRQSKTMAKKPAPNGLNIEARSVGDTEFFILDFTNILGVDATAARACFLMLVQLLRACHVVVVFAAIPRDIERLLRAHGVIGDEDIVIETLDDALEWCEEEVLYRATHPKGVAKESVNTSDLSRDLKYYENAWKQRQTFSAGEDRFHHKQQPAADDLRDDAAAEESPGSPPKSPHRDFRALRRILEDYLEVNGGENGPLYSLLRSDVLSKYFERKTFSTGCEIFSAGEGADEVYFVEDGAVEMVSPPQHNLGHVTPVERPVVRLQKYSPGCVFGATCFCLRQDYEYPAIALSTPTTLFVLSRAQLANMEYHHPSLCILMQQVLLKSLGMSYQITVTKQSKH